MESLLQEIKHSNISQKGEQMPTLIIIGYIALELLSFSLWASTLGFFSLFLEIVCSGFLGLWLWSSRTRSLSASLNDIIYFMYEGRILDLLKSNMLFYLGSILLILPGLASDSAGIICILASFLIQPKPLDSDFTRDFRHRQNRQHSEYKQFDFDSKPKKDSISDDDIIEVEIIDENQEQKSQEQQSSIQHKNTKKRNKNDKK